jgi:hypothetical protein
MEFNDAGMRKLFAEVSKNIEAADAEFRRTHTGLPVDVVVADFATHGPALDLPEVQLHAYATAASQGEPFEFRLT